MSGSPKIRMKYEKYYNGKASFRCIVEVFENIPILKNKCSILFGFRNMSRESDEARILSSPIQKSNLIFNLKKSFSTNFHKSHYKNLLSQVSATCPFNLSPLQETHEYNQYGYFSIKREFRYGYEY